MGRPILRYGLDLNAVVTRRGGGNTRSREHLDALLAKRLFELRRNGLVFSRCDAGKQFNQGYVAPEPTEDGRELDTDRARSQNHQRFWYFAQVYRFVAGDDSSAVEHDVWNAARCGSRSDDDVACRQGLLVAFKDLYLAGSGKARSAFNPVNLVLFEQKLNAPGQPRDDLVLARVNLTHV